MARRLNPQANSVYGTPQGISPQTPPPVVAQRAPTTSDTGFQLGQVWVNEAASTVYVLTNVAGGVATWQQASAAASNVNTINSVAPVANNIDILGGTDLTVSLGVGTVTLDLDPAITLATSVTSPIYASAAAMAINVAAGSNITMKMGDAAGANKISFVDSTSAEVAKLDSNGIMTAVDFEGTIGATAPAAGTFTTGTATTAFVAPSFTAPAATDTEVDAIGGQNVIIKLGDAAGANKLSIQDSGAAEVFSIDSNGVVGTLAGLTVAGAFAQTAGTFNVGQDNAANAINIGGGTTARAIGIGNSAAPHVLTVGSNNAAAQTILQAGTVGLSETSTGPLTLDAAGVLEINSSGGVISIGNDAIAQAINVGGAGARTITIGNNTGVTSVVLDVGTGNCDLGVTATAHTTRVGSTTGVSATTVQCGSGVLAVNGGGAMNIDAAGQLQINSSASTIDIGNDVVAQNMNIGTGGARVITIGSNTGATSVVVNTGTGAASFGATATDHSTTIGSTVGVSATTIQSGTGETTFVGIVKEIDAEFLYASGDDVIFQSNPVVQSALNTGVAPTGATGDVNIVMCQEGISMEEFVVGAGQTILAPRMDANGLIVSGDLTLAEDYEYNFGAALTNSRHAFTIGTSAPFFFELQYRIADMSGAAPYIFGFRKVEANQAVYTDYTDYATIGMIAGSSLTEIVTSTELNGGGNTVTNTTDLWGGDGASKTLKVLVDAAGNVTYTINGAAPSVSAAFQFDAGDVVVPFIRIEHSATPGLVQLKSMKIGYQA